MSEQARENDAGADIEPDGRPLLSERSLGNGADAQPSGQSQMSEQARENVVGARIEPSGRPEV